MTVVKKKYSILYTVYGHDKHTTEEATSSIEAKKQFKKSTEGKKGSFISIHLVKK